MSEIRPSSNASVQAPNDGAFRPFSLLPDGPLDNIFSFIGNGQYRYIAGTNHRFRNVYSNPENGRSKDTFWSAAAESVPRVSLLVEDYTYLWLDRDMHVLWTAVDNIILKAVAIGNVPVLKWSVDNYPATSSWKLLKLSTHTILPYEDIGRYGHLNVLEWMDSTYKFVPDSNYKVLIVGLSGTGANPSNF